MAEKKTNIDKLMKVLQIVSGVIIVAMVVIAIIMMKKYNISLKNADELAAKVNSIQGGVVVIAALFVAFTVIKSFALVFPPAVIFVVSGLVFKGNPLLAIGVNFIGTALSMILPYYLGKFTGKSMVDTLKKRFKKVQKIDDFAGQNDFSIVFVIKASGCMPSDISSLIFGAMNIAFRRYFLAANVGMLPLIICWTLLGAYGDFKNPLSFFIVFPIPVLAVVLTLINSKRNKKKALAEGEAKAE